MSKPTLPNDPELQAYRDALRAYELGLTTWLGLDPHQVFRVDETETEGDLRTRTPASLSVTWEATDQLVPTRGVQTDRTAWGSSEEPTRYGGTVLLDYELLRQLRDEVGHRPEFPRLAELRRMFPEAGRER